MEFHVVLPSPHTPICAHNTCRHLLQSHCSSRNSYPSTGTNANGMGVKVTKGILCAVSVGMLIYAACMEMLMANFVLDLMLWRASKSR